MFFFAEILSGINFDEKRSLSLLTLFLKESSDDDDDDKDKTDGGFKIS